MVYASGTTVSVEKSRTEIERTLARYGATSFMYGSNEVRDLAVVGFVVKDRQMRFLLTLPRRTSPQFTSSPGGRSRSASVAQNAWEQAMRERWRALALVIKAKLEAVESSITTFETEFAMHMVLPDGRTAEEVVLPAIEQAYATGNVPPMLAIAGGSE